MCPSQLVNEIRDDILYVRIRSENRSKIGVDIWEKGWGISIFSLVISISYNLAASALVPWYFIDKSYAQTLKAALATPYTYFAVVASLLIDLKIMNSELGRIALASSLIRDILTTVLHSISIFLRIGANAHYLAAGGASFLFLSYIAAIVFGGYPLFLWIIKQTPEGQPVKSVYITFICFATIVSAIIADNFGFNYQFGPFILGLAVPLGPPLGSILEKRLSSTMGLFVPILVTYSGINANFIQMYNASFHYALWMTYVCGVIFKVSGVVISALLANMSAEDGLVLGLVMNPQGVVELSDFLRSRQIESLDEETFTFLTAAVLATVIVIPILVRAFYDYSRTYIGYQKRNILHAAHNAELRIVACAHKQDDAVAIVKVLEASNPTKQSPISVYALHLVELLGGATPLIINHRFGQKSTSSRSQPIIDIFHVYELQNSGLVNVHAFTAISMPKFMHDDVCLLAFDKLASLIILPFHKKWNLQGKLVFDNNVMRNLNIQVMDMAPCSVGILIDRHRVRLTPTTLSSSLLYRVAVIFLGGDDDREALAYAKRMANSPGVHLTVFRLRPFDETSTERNWESVLDAEILKDINAGYSVKDNVVYREERVKDGADTGVWILSMEEDYDLIMVGRRHKLDRQLLSGLTEWTEMPELGEIGDLLASPEIVRPVSVLVVQQQHMQKNSG